MDKEVDQGGERLRQLRTWVAGKHVVYTVYLCEEFGIVDSEDEKLTRCIALSETLVIRPGLAQQLLPIFRCSDKLRGQIRNMR